MWGTRPELEGTPPWISAVVQSVLRSLRCRVSWYTSSRWKNASGVSARSKACCSTDLIPAFGFFAAIFIDSSYCSCVCVGFLCISTVVVCDLLWLYSRGDYNDWKCVRYPHHPSCALFDVTDVTRGACSAAVREGPLITGVTTACSSKYFRDSYNMTCSRLDAPSRVLRW